MYIYYVIYSIKLLCIQHIRHDNWDAINDDDLNEDNETNLFNPVEYILKKILK